MIDAECPYCGAGVEICHDDGQGYEEDQIHEQECRSCDKVFAFTTSISFHYSPRKADCLNGGDHKYRRTVTFPRKYTRMRCDDCGGERPMSKEEKAEFLEEIS